MSTIHCYWLAKTYGFAGLPGDNELADSAAKDALQLPVTDYRVPFTDFRLYANKYVASRWQRRWDTLTSNKLHAVKAKLGIFPAGYRNVRREEVILSRLRIGHTRLTHAYLLSGDPQPWCVSCDVEFSVKHFLLECVEFALVRQKYFGVSTIMELFQERYTDMIISYLKEIRLYDNIWILFWINIYQYFNQFYSTACDTDLFIVYRLNNTT